MGIDLVPVHSHFTITAESSFIAWPGIQLTDLLPPLPFSSYYLPTSLLIILQTFLYCCLFLLSSNEWHYFDGEVNPQKPIALGSSILGKILVYLSFSNTHIPSLPYLPYSKQSYSTLWLRADGQCRPLIYIKALDKEEQFPTSRQVGPG